MADEIKNQQNDKRFQLPFDPMQRIYWTGVKMGVPTALIAVYYLYYTARLSFELAMNMFVFIAVCLVVEFAIKLYVQGKLAFNIRKFDHYMKNKLVPPIEMIQDVWVETINFPIRIVLGVTFLVTFSVVVIPTTIFSYFVYDIESLWKHVLIAGFLAILSLCIINLLLYEKALSPLLIKIEEFGKGKINFSDERIYFVSTKLKFLIFFVGITVLLAVLIGVIVYERISFICETGNYESLNLDQLQIEIMATSFIVFILGVLFSYVLIRHQTQPLLLISEHLQGLGKGELKKQFYSASAGVVHDEDNLIAEVFSEMTEKLSEVLNLILDSGHKLNNEMRSILNQSNDYSKTLNQQNASISALTASLEESAAFSRRINQDSKNVLQAMDLNLEDTRTGQVSFQRVIDGLDNLRGATQLTHNQIGDLTEKLTLIEEVADIIRKVAEKSHIIAFNAFLEAADDDKTDNFEAVAVSIKNLTTQVTHLAEEVRSLIQSVIESVSLINSRTEQNVTFINNEMQTSKVFYNEIGNLIRSINETNEMVKKITISTRQQDKTNEKVTECLSQINQLINDDKTNRTDMEKQLKVLNQQVNVLHDSIQTTFLNS